jgi:hypothetical protein
MWGGTFVGIPTPIDVIDGLETNRVEKIAQVDAGCVLTRPFETRCAAVAREQAEIDDQFEHWFTLVQTHGLPKVGSHLVCKHVGVAVGSIAIDTRQAGYLVEEDDE